jgi:hypothetical protein
VPEVCSPLGRYRARHMALLKVRCSIVLRSLEHNLNDLLHSSQYFLSSSRTVLIQGRSSRYSSHWAQFEFSVATSSSESKNTCKCTRKHLPLSTNEKYSLNFHSPFRHRCSNSASFDHITADCGAAGVAMTTGTCIHMSTAACVSYGLDSAKQVQMVALSSRFTAYDLDWSADFAFS